MDYEPRLKGYDENFLLNGELSLAHCRPYRHVQGRYVLGIRSHIQKRRLSTPAGVTHSGILGALHHGFELNSHSRYTLNRKRNRGSAFAFLGAVMERPGPEPLATPAADSPIESEADTRKVIANRVIRAAVRIGVPPACRRQSPHKGRYLTIV